MEVLLACSVCGSTNIKVIDCSCNISECMDCGYVFDNPRPPFDSVISFYSRTARYPINKQPTWSRTRLCKRRLEMVLRHRKSGRLLDVGAGSGDFIYIAKSFFEVYGTEVSQSGVLAAKARYNLDLFNGELQAITFPVGQFDVITLFHVLEHVPNPTVTIRRCYELLKTGGVLILAVPNDIAGLRLIIVRCLRFLGLKRFQIYGRIGLPKLVLDGSIEEIHYSHFTLPVLQKLLAGNQFQIVETTIDRHYTETGVVGMVYDVLYYVSLLVFKISKRNIFLTTWIAAERAG